MQEGGRDVAYEIERVWGVQGEGCGVQPWTEQDGFRAGDGVERKVGMWTEGDGDRFGDGDGKGTAGKPG